MYMYMYMYMYMHMHMYIHIHIHNGHIRVYIYIYIHHMYTSCLLFVHQHAPLVDGLQPAQQTRPRWPPVASCECWLLITAKRNSDRATENCRNVILYQIRSHSHHIFLCDLLRKINPIYPHLVGWTWGRTIAWPLRKWKALLLDEGLSPSDESLWQWNSSIQQSQVYDIAGSLETYGMDPHE